MNKSLLRYFMLCLTVMLSMVLNAQTYVPVTQSNSSVSKVDVSSLTLSSITLTVTLNPGEAPNGQAQLRTTADETKPVSNGASLLADNVLTQKSTDPNVWTITWNNVPIGDYNVYFQQAGGTTHTLLNSTPVNITEIKTGKDDPNYKSPTMKLTVENSYCDPNNPTNATNGSVKIEIAGGETPLNYSATINHADGSKETVTNPNSTLRAWSIDGLAKGETVAVTVTDVYGSTVTQTSGAVGYSEVSVSVDRNGYFVQTGDCTFDAYVKVRISGGTPEAQAAQTQMLAESMMFSPYTKNTWTALEYVPSLDDNSTTYKYRYFKFPSTFTSGYYDLKFNTLCNGEKIVSGAGNLGKQADMVEVTATSTGNPCEGVPAKYTVNFTYQAPSSWYKTYYYFLQDAAHQYAKLYKKKADGTYDMANPINSQVPMPVKGFDAPYSTSIEVTEPGTYKLVYGDPSCQQAYFEKEVTVEPLASTNFLTLKGVKQCYTIYGNTAGIEFRVSDTTAPITATIERPDGQSSFQVTDFLSDKVYTKTINFPIEHTFATTQPYYVMGDLPAGDYILKVANKCGDVAEQPFTITDADLQHYVPKNDEGFKDGVYVGVDCDGNNVVKFNFGQACINAALRIKHEYSSKGTTFGNNNLWESDKEGLSPMTGLYDIAVGFAPAYKYDSGGNSTNIYYYSSIEDIQKEYGQLSVEGTGTDTYDVKNYSFNFAPETAATNFEVTSAYADLTQPNQGIISAAPVAGRNITLPVKYDLYETTDGITLSGPVLRTYSVTGQYENNFIVWTDVPEGKYIVDIVYGNNCGVRRFVEVSRSQLPYVVVNKPDGQVVADPSAGNDKIVVDITNQDMTPWETFLPVSPHVYDLKWTDELGFEITSTNGSVYPTFDKPGVYTYNVEATFDYALPVGGTVAGSRSVTFIVTKIDTNSNLWVGSVDTNFNNAENWTKKKVPVDGEDIIFATKYNYTSPAVNNCVLANGTEPLTFTCKDLTNESEKAMVIPGGSSLTVSGNLQGFVQNPDGKKGLIRLIIEAGKADQPNGTFICTSYVPVWPYGEVQMNILAQKSAGSWTDNVEGSPTFGKTFNSQYKEQFFGVPFHEMLAKQFLQLPSPVYLKQYSELLNSDSTFYQKFSTLADPYAIMGPLQGYSIAYDGPAVVKLRGQLNTKSTSYHLSRRATEVTAVASTITDDKVRRWGLGMNLLGNPYTAPIKISALNLPFEIERTVYLYNTGSGADWGNAGAGSTSGNGAGTYTAVPMNTAEQQGIDEIPSMQGFMLKYTEDQRIFNGPDIPLLLEYPNVVTPNATQAQRAKALVQPTTTDAGFVKVALMSNNMVNDVMWLFEQPNTSDDFDNGWDGAKLGAEQLSTVLYSQSKAGQLQVNTSDNILNANITVKIGAEGSYKLTMTRSGLDNYTDLKLVDSKTEMLVPFNGNTLEYSFSSAASTEGERFFLVNTPLTTYKEYVTGINNLTMSQNFGPAVVYTLSGKTVADVVMPQDMPKLKQQLPAGVYIVAPKDGKPAQKMIITK